MKYLRRGIWFLAGRLILASMIIALAVTVFYYAMNLSNIQIILKDGLACRAKVIMGIEENKSELNKYFQAAGTASDEQLTAALGGSSPYADYNVRGIDHRMEMGFFWTWPWDNAVRLTVKERIPRIDGRVRGTRADEVISQNGANAVYPPDWPDATYRVGLVKENGQWKIRSMTIMSEQ